jgi:hypothetical protein
MEKNEAIVSVETYTIKHESKTTSSRKVACLLVAPNNFISEGQYETVFAPC